MNLKGCRIRGLVAFEVKGQALGTAKAVTVLCRSRRDMEIAAKALGIPKLQLEECAAVEVTVVEMLAERRLG